MMEYYNNKAGHPPTPLLDANSINKLGDTNDIEPEDSVDKGIPTPEAVGSESLKLTDGNQEIILGSSRYNVVELISMAKGILQDETFSKFIKTNGGNHESKNYVG